LALMLLTDARREARVSEDGTLVVLSDQDRSKWNSALIEEGHDLVRKCLRRKQPGPYQLQAAISAVHTDPPTDWRQVVALYDQLMTLAPSRVAALNRAVAVAELDGAAAGLTLIDQLALDDYHLTHAIRADLLRRLARDAEALAAYDRAIAATRNAVERDYLTRRRAELA